MPMLALMPKNQNENNDIGFLMILTQKCQFSWRFVSVGLVYGLL
jgi:hypothetical protein